jgi:predicted permease
MALSVMLLAGAGLLIRSFVELQGVDPGFRGEGVLLVDADVRGANTPPDRRLSVHEEMLNRLRALPGVRSASASQLTPVGGGRWNEMLKVAGFTPKDPDDAACWANAVSDGYFATLGIPLRAGRDFDARDTKTSGRVAIVSESMAKKFFRTPAAVGLRFEKEEGSGWSPPIEIIGVVGDTKYRSLRDSAQPVIYFPRAQEAADAQNVSFELRIAGGAASVVPSIVRTIAAVHPRISLDFKMLDSQLAESLALSRAVATLSGFFGALAVLLATIGLYGIMAYTVARRRNEIGVRIALGAGQSRVVRMVLGEVGRIVAAGVVIGLALSLGATRLVGSFLYGVKPDDPTLLLASALLLAAIGVAAAAMPAWRASRLDPVAALREE